MTVEELQALLAQYPKDAKVFLDREWEGTFELDNVDYDYEDNSVTLGS